MDKQTTILRAAIVLFMKNGYKKTTVDQIAKVAGMSKANLYNYFKTKEEIFQATKLSDILKEKNPIHDAKKIEMMQIALRLFGQKGYGNTTMEEISSSMGFSPAYIYHFFPNKLSLYQALVQDIAKEIDLSVSKEYTQVERQRSLQVAAESFLSVFREPQRAALFRMIIFEGDKYPELLDILNKDFFRGIFSLLFICLQENGLIENTDPDFLQRLFWGALIGYVVESNYLGRASHSAEETAAMFAKIFYRGIAE